jgi:hypothetical protein
VQTRVQTLWTYDGINGAGDLSQYGTVSFDPASKVTRTDGSVTLTFDPYDEVVPGFGASYADNGIVNAGALYQSAFGSALGSIVQFLDPKQAIGHWTVSRHVPRGFMFKGLRIETQHSISSGLAYVIYTTTFSGQVCGENPYTQWSFDRHLFAQDEVGSNEIDDTAHVLIEKGGTQLNLGGEGTISLSLVPNPGAPYFQAGFAPSDGFHLVGPSSQQVPVTEDMSCPAPTP